VAEIERHDVQALIDAMRKDGAGQGSLDQEQALLRAFFYYADELWNWSQPARNPATGLRMPRSDNARDRVMSEDEEARLLRALDDARNPQAVLVVQLLVETAMRCGEPLEHAVWGNVHWDQCLLRLDDGKTGRRDVPLSPRAMALLKTLHGLGPRHPREPIVRLSYEALKAVWKRACERAGICDLVLHDLRHTAATRLALRTGNVFLVQRLTGHKTLSQVQRYVNVKAADVVRVLHESPPVGTAQAPAPQTAAAPRLPAGGAEKGDPCGSHGREDLRGPEAPCEPDGDDRKVVCVDFRARRPHHRGPGGAVAPSPRW
jgi:integrase